MGNIKVGDKVRFLNTTGFSVRSRTDVQSFFNSSIQLHFSKRQNPGSFNRLQRYGI